MNVYFLIAESQYFFTFIHRFIDNKFFDLFCLRVGMSYHWFNNLAELLNGDLAAKIGQGILFYDLMDSECNHYLPYKVNVKYVYNGKWRDFF